MLAKDFLKTVYFKVKQSGAGASIGGDRLPVLNEALYEFFDHQGYRRAWQHTIEEIPAAQFKHGNMFQLNTTFPILDVHKFFEIPKEKCTDWVDFCKPLGELKTWIDSCGAGVIGVSGITTVNQCGRISVYNDGELEMEHRKPKSTLSAGQFSMLDGAWGNVIRGMLPTSLKDSHKVYMIYYRGFVELTSLNDDIQIPNNLTPALSYLVASKIIDTGGQFRSGDGSYMRSIFTDLIKSAHESQPQTIGVLKMKGY